MLRQARHARRVPAFFRVMPTPLFGGQKVLARVGAAPWPVARSSAKPFGVPYCPVCNKGREQDLASGANVRREKQPGCRRSAVQALGSLHRCLTMLGAGSTPHLHPTGLFGRPRPLCSMVVSLAAPKGLCVSEAFSLLLIAVHLFPGQTSFSLTAVALGSSSVLLSLGGAVPRERAVCSECFPLALARHRNFPAPSLMLRLCP